MQNIPSNCLFILLKLVYPRLYFRPHSNLYKPIQHPAAHEFGEISQEWPSADFDIFGAVGTRCSFGFHLFEGFGEAQRWAHTQEGTDNGLWQVHYGFSAGTGNSCLMRRKSRLTRGFRLLSRFTGRPATTRNTFSRHIGLGTFSGSNGLFCPNWRWIVLLPWRSASRTGQSAGLSWNWLGAGIFTPTPGIGPRIL